MASTWRVVNPRTRTAPSGSRSPRRRVPFAPSQGGPGSSRRARFSRRRGLRGFRCARDRSIDSSDDAPQPERVVAGSSSAFRRESSLVGKVRRLLTVHSRHPGWPSAQKGSEMTRVRQAVGRVWRPMRTLVVGLRGRGELSIGRPGCRKARKCAHFERQEKLGSTTTFAWRATQRRSSRKRPVDRTSVCSRIDVTAEAVSFLRRDRAQPSTAAA